ncbi:MAG TPA: ATP-binding protein [Polyangiaceae bacterium]|nr:ATP-binding protein [Polyangiaceae bacterium]
MTLGIRAKLVLISFALIVVCLGITYSFVASVLQAAIVERARESALVSADLSARALTAELANPDVRLDEVARELAARAKARVTLLDEQGRVVGDSLASAGDKPTFTAPDDVRGLLQGTSRTKVAIGDDRTMQAFAPFEASARRGVVRVIAPMTELGAASATLRSWALSATVLALALAVVMSSLTASIVSRTARSLTAVAKRMAAGELTARSRVTSRDEFGELGRALDQLARGVTHSLGELQEERDRLNGILSGMQEGVLLLDAGGRIVLVNPALREMLLLGTDAVRKTLLEAIRHAELKELLDESRQSLEPVTREIDIGGIKPRRLLVRVAALPGEQGQTFAVFVDVTEIRRLESMRRDFVANVSHELRTPVTAIRSAAETLQTGIPEDKRVLAQFIGIIERNAARLQDLVEDVLNLSRIESRELRLVMEPLDLRATYGQVISLFRERAERKRITLSNEAMVGLARVVADRRAIEHVLTNLVDNAVKYCTAGCSVRVGAVELPDAVRLFVADSGPGIEPRHLPRIFERFYRVDAGRSRELGGTGLGLSIVKHLVEAMGGSVQVESATGRGTTFSFTLPKAAKELGQAVA